MVTAHATWPQRFRFCSSCWCVFYPLISLPCFLSALHCHTKNKNAPKNNLKRKAKSFGYMTRCYKHISVQGILFFWSLCKLHKYYRLEMFFLSVSQPTTIQCLGLFYCFLQRIHVNKPFTQSVHLHLGYGLCFSDI